MKICAFFCRLSFTFTVAAVIEHEDTKTELMKGQKRIEAVGKIGIIAMGIKIIDMEASFQFM